MYSTFFVLKVCTCKISQFLDFFYLMPSILFSVFWQWNLKQRWWRYFLPFLFGQKLYLGPFLNRHKQFCKVFCFRREISQKACVSDTRKIVLLLKKNNDDESNKKSLCILRVHDWLQKEQLGRKCILWKNKKIANRFSWAMWSRYRKSFEQQNRISWHPPFN